ncbi:MAG: malto-oligosyltrehalose trehalohydrolase [Bacteroidales bacterium]
MHPGPTRGRSIGVNFHKGQPPSILVWAPKARRLAMEVEGKGIFSLEKRPFGYWQASCPGLEPGDRYRLNINGKKNLPDPASLSQPEGVHAFSECVDLNEIRSMGDKDWKGVAVQDLVIYELHTACFSPRGNFQGIEEKLDYLKDLGINAIEIMPVAAFAGSRSWGYDGVFPFAVQQSYGGARAFAALIRACHRQGIAVILDVVYNHLGPESQYLESFGPYFTDKYRTSWGKAINFDGAWSDSVRQYFLENAMMWLRDFQVDGLRLDAVHAIRDQGPKHFLQVLSGQVQELNAITGKRHFLIGECDLNDIRFITPAGQGGFGLDAQWCDEWHHALHALMTGERRSYFSDFGGLSHLAKSFNHAYVYTGQYSHHRKKTFGTPTSGQPGQRFVVFSQNHDQVGNRMMGDRLSTLLDFEGLKLAAGALLVSPFVPLLFMGEEYAEDSPFLFFASHLDQHLSEQVRKGRKREFRDFMETADPPDPAARETFERSKLKWDWTREEKKSQMLAFYKKIIRLRKEHALLKPGNRDHVRASETPCGRGIVLRRGNTNEGLKKKRSQEGREHETIYALMNFSEDMMLVEIPHRRHDPLPELLICSAQKQWGGPIGNQAIPFRQTTSGLVVETGRKSILVFRLKAR